MSGWIYKFPTSGPARFAPPVPGGKLCGMFPYAWRRGELVPHTGIDLCAPRGTPIVVPLPGVVTRRTTTTYGGNNVTIRHGDFVTYYAHCDEIFVGVGQKVKQHEVIATVGQTGVTRSGASIDPHLHWQVMASEDFSSKHYDPVALLDALGVYKDGLTFYWKHGFPKAEAHAGGLWLAVVAVGVVSVLVLPRMLREVP